MKCITYGIHTRLYYIIKRTGGLNKEMRKEYLKNKFGFDDETVDLVLMYDIEHLLIKNTIEEIKYYINQKNIYNKKQIEYNFNGLSNILKNIYCNSDMLHLFSYYYR